ncbi:MAG: hypothetical protein AAF791_09860, partial [Bacteroidota bacterium]
MLRLSRSCGGIGPDAPESAISLWRAKIAEIGTEADASSDPMHVRISCLLTGAPRPLPMRFRLFTLAAVAALVLVGCDTS